MPSGDAAARAVYSLLTDGANAGVITVTNAALAENANAWLQSAAALYALDGSASAGAQQVPLKVQSTAQPNLRVSHFNGANQMPPGDAAAREIFVGLADGTNGPAAVKAASTQAAAADKALVVRPMMMTDGTNPTVVKAASTAAALTDAALVVALSPNCPLSKPTAGSPIRVSAKTTIKGSAGVLFSLSMINTTASTVWAQFWDQSTVTVGTTLPDLEFQVPANSQLTPPLADYGWPFGTGLVFAATTAEAGATVASVGALLLFPTYA